MADITLSYKGSTIAEVSASGTTKLNTKGKFCEDDITLQYVKPTAYVKLAEAEITASTTSTSISTIGEINIDPASDVWTSAYMIFVTVRDKAGKRSGYFLGSDTIFSNPNPANGTTTNITAGARNIYSYTSDGAFALSNGAYGVYAYDINNSGRIRIATRYNSTSSLTINGTYKVEVYALKFPGNVSPFA